MGRSFWLNKNQTSRGNIRQVWEKAFTTMWLKKFKFCSLIYNWKFNILISFTQESIYYTTSWEDGLHRASWIRILNEFWLDIGLRFANEFRGERWNQLEQYLHYTVHVSSVFVTVVYFFHIVDSAHFWIKLAYTWGISSFIRALKSWLESLLHVRHFFCAWYRQ